jgi:hypothetical protein
MGHWARYLLESVHCKSQLGLAGTFLKDKAPGKKETLLTFRSFFS